MWLDRLFLGRYEVTVHSMRCEGWRHLDLVHVACDHRSNGREGLKRFAIVLPASVVAEMNIRDHLDKASDAGLRVAYFATPEQAREWFET